MLGHLQGHVFLCLCGGGAKVRCHNHVGQVEQWAIGGGFNREHIKGSTGDVAGFQGFCQRLFIDKTTTGAVHNAHAFFQLGNVFCRQDVLGLVGQRNVHRDKISAAQQFVQFNLFYADFRGAFFRQERIVGDNLHAQAKRAVNHDGPDITGTNHTKRLVRQLYTHKAGLFPFTGMG